MPSTCFERFLHNPQTVYLQVRNARRGSARRVNAARGEIRHRIEFDYAILNQESAPAVDDLAATMRAARLRSKPQRIRHVPLLTQLT